MGLKLLDSKIQDRLARWVISTVGVGTIFAIVAILFVVVREFFPLFISPKIELLVDQQIDEQAGQGEAIEVGMSAYFEQSSSFERGFVLNRAGEIVFSDISTGKRVLEKKLREDDGIHVLSSSYESGGELSLLWSDGRLDLYKIRFRVSFEKEGGRRITPGVERVDGAKFKLDVKKGLVRQIEEGGKIFAALRSDGSIALKVNVESEGFDDEVEIETHEHRLEVESDTILNFSVDRRGRMVYALTGKGLLVRWDLAEADSPELKDKVRVSKAASLTAIEVLLGDNAVAVGDSDGWIRVFAPVASSDAQSGKILKPIHEFSAGGLGVKRIVASPRDRTLMIRDNSDVLHLFYSTNETELLTLDVSGTRDFFSVSGRGKGVAMLSREGKFRAYRLDSPHPESGWKSMFGQVWYESYNEPEFVWQSSSGSDDFEPKLSLVPLIFGSLKGAIYAMIFSVPIAILAALYISQFAGKRLQRMVKPVVEVMAAVPSVVVGFLAALWLAPIIDNHLLPIFVLLMFFPLMLFFFLFLPNNANKGSQKKERQGIELFMSFPLILMLMITAYVCAEIAENYFFDNNFKASLIEFLEGDYDMRNSVIIALALGFTVIPIIFTMSEDALSSVPKGLSSASLALGASPWQTAWMVVLPAASPGIFAGIILGLGRAVGETMIVLMATGNTPIIDMNIFNGMRALSANIAVEIPEAPVGGTLYRVLFLSAAVLLVFTSILNTITEVIRQRLRKMYSKF